MIFLRSKILLPAIILSAFMLSCARNEKELVQGMWEAIAVETIVDNRAIQHKTEVSGFFCEFKDDQFYQYTQLASGELDTSAVNNYTMNKQSIKLEPKIGEPEIRYKYRFFNGDLNLVLRQVNKEGNGSEMMYKRKSD